jgi:hypothetical protein
VFLFAGGALAAAFMAWRRRDLPRVRLSLALGAAAGVLSLVVFSVTNPAIMIDPVEGLPAVLTYQQHGLAYLQTLMPDRSLTTLPAKFRAVSNVAFGLAGFALVAAWSLLAAVRRPRPGVWFVGAWWVVTTVVVTLWIPFAWPRYVLPVIPPMLLLLAYAVTATTARVADGVRAGAHARLARASE